jgi:FdhD protein
MADMVRSFDVVRVRGGSRPMRNEELDCAVTEEPLEIRLHGRPFAVVMRTPGNDRELAAGFLLSERVILGADDLGTIEFCADAQRASVQSAERRRPEETAPDSNSSAGNVVSVTLANHSRLERAFAERRHVTATASCGVCGRLTIESLATEVEPLANRWSVPADLLFELPDRLRAAQAVFTATGGLHAAGLFDRDGTLADFSEDVGRHNAVDKVIGRMLMRDALPLADHLLCVSGRTSFEIVQKAAIAGIPLVAAVSAPSSLAIDLARALGLTLVGFVRGTSFNIYAHAERIVT